MVQPRFAAAMAAQEAERIFDEARAASAAAAKVENDRLPPETKRGLDCGFAWVVIRPARGSFVQYLKSQSIGSTRDYGGGGYEIWYSKMHDEATQSISVHEAAARAFADVLAKHGIKASVGSRLD